MYSDSRDDKIGHRVRRCLANVPLQPRRLIIAPAAVGCKRCYAAPRRLKESLFQRRLLSRSSWICLEASSTCISTMRRPNSAVALAGLPT